MAWGSQGAVFLGDDLMHTRDYSDETSRVIDIEVEKILREQEQRATDALRTHRGGLESVAKALLEKETIPGSEVTRLVDEAYGRPVHQPGEKPEVPEVDVPIDPPMGRQPQPGFDHGNGQGNGGAHQAEPEETGAPRR